MVKYCCFVFIFFSLFSFLISIEDKQIDQRKLYNKFLQKGNYEILIDNIIHSINLQKNIELNISFLASLYHRNQIYFFKEKLLSQKKNIQPIVYQLLNSELNLIEKKYLEALSHIYFINLALLNHETNIFITKELENYWKNKIIIIIDDYYKNHYYHHYLILLQSKIIENELKKKPIEKVISQIIYALQQEPLNSDLVNSIEKKYILNSEFKPLIRVDSNFNYRIINKYFVSSDFNSIFNSYSNMDYFPVYLSYIKKHIDPKTKLKDNINKIQHVLTNINHLNNSSNLLTVENVPFIDFLVTLYLKDDMIWTVLKKYSLLSPLYSFYLDIKHNQKLVNLFLDVLWLEHFDPNRLIEQYSLYFVNLDLNQLSDEKNKNNEYVKVHNYTLNAVIYFLIWRNSLDDQKYFELIYNKYIRNSGSSVLGEKRDEISQMIWQYTSMEEQFKFLYLTSFSKRQDTKNIKYKKKLNDLNSQFFIEYPHTFWRFDPLNQVRINLFNQFLLKYPKTLKK